MVEAVVPVPEDFSCEQIRRAFIAFVHSAGLVGEEMTLKKYPGCVHWHLRKPGEKGTLEATWWPAERRFWFSIHENRRGDWQSQTILALEATFVV